MPKWSKQAKKIVKSYNAYKKKVRSYTEKYNLEYDPLSYNEYKEVYEERAEEVKNKERKRFGNIDWGLIQKEERPEVLYQRYLETFDRREDYLMKRGITPYDAVRMNKNQFLLNYNAYRNDLKKEVEAGERSQIGDIISRMVSDQVYEMSSSQYEANIKAINEWNEAHPEQAISLGDTFNKNSLYWQMQIRSGETLRQQGWGDLIEARRRELFAQGKTKEQTRKEISRQFYGSK